MFRWFRVYRLLPDSFFIWLAVAARSILGFFDPVSITFVKEMLHAMPPRYFSRAIHAIVTWDNETYDERIIHLHGSKDFTLPLRNIRNFRRIEGGSHVMVLTKPGEINMILNRIFSENT
jgi:hypothetical protein